MPREHGDAQGTWGHPGAQGESLGWGRDSQERGDTQPTERGQRRERGEGQRWERTAGGAGGLPGREGAARV